MLSPNFSIPLHSTEIFLCNTWIFCRFVCLFDDRIIICRLLFINLDLAWCLLESKLLLARIYLYIYIVFRKICNIVECSICSFDVQFNTDLIRGLSTHKKKKHSHSQLTLHCTAVKHWEREREREKHELYKFVSRFRAPSILVCARVVCVLYALTLFPSILFYAILQHV